MFFSLCSVSFVLSNFFLLFFFYSYVSFSSVSFPTNLFFFPFLSVGFLSLPHNSCCFIPVFLFIFLFCRFPSFFSPKHLAFNTYFVVVPLPLPPALLSSFSPVAFAYPYRWVNIRRFYQVLCLTCSKLCYMYEYCLLIFLV